MAYLRKEYLKSAADVSGLWEKLASMPEKSIKISVCCWTDLLGFGKPFFEKNWQIGDEDWKLQAERISNAHINVYSNIESFEFMLTLNDGIVRCCDTDYFSGIDKITMQEVDENDNVKSSETSESPHLDFLSIWLRSCIYTHNAVNESEQDVSLPGARTVLAAGDTLKYSHINITLDDLVYNYTKKNPKKMSKLAKISGNPVIASNPGPLQMNLAFSKAFIIESLGSSAGIKGAHFYIDDSFISVACNLYHELRSEHKIIDKLEHNVRHLIMLKDASGTHCYLGFGLADPPIVISCDKIKTKVWRLLYYHPWDEKVSDFRINVV